MHPYSHDASRTRSAYLLLAVVAILLAWALGSGLHAIRVSPPWWLDTPAVVGMYGLLWKWYDRVLWRVRVGGQTLSGIPDYGGSWNGSVHSSHEGGMTFPAHLTIHQTSSRLLVELQTELSGSMSHVAMLCGRPGRDRGLQYVYANWPRHVPPDASAQPSPPPSQRAVPLAMHAHEGVARLLLRADGTLDGDYQNDRHRGTYGTLSFDERVSS
ncbi:hypothetical protein [Dactylosporangium sp. CA-139066]|uniref:Cap15 family cyclic dinucleotide receptor domain-containing protein n=1 Tax=Dactylosporangium sp. CA-139066 TaxID=3239930 RepID=UPI003D9509E8